MSNPTFMQWLMKQNKRNDPVGDLARDVKDDRRRKPKSRKGWRRFLSDANACDGALHASEQAWNEYESAA